MFKKPMLFPLIGIVFFCLTFSVKGFSRTLDDQLMRAVNAIDTAKVRSLLARGANPNAREINGRGPLWWACTSDRRLEIARLLIARGANINARDKEGKTPLMIAAQGNMQILKLLLSKGANIHLKDNKGQTAFKIATRYHWREIAKVLKQAGARE